MTINTSMKRNKYGAVIDLYKDGEITIGLDLDKQINHYTKKQRLSMYDALVKTAQDFIL